MAQKPRAGRFNRRIGLQKPNRTDTGVGGKDKTWQAAIPLWAELIPLRGDEAMANNLTRNVQVWKVTIRFRTDVTPDCRLLLGDRPMNIRSCEDPDGRRAELVMTAETGVRT